MAASPFRLLRGAPPPPKVALLSDSMFFTRAVPVTPGATAAEVAGQVELALEAVAPFPLGQLYYGWYWKPGAESALVFASYRRRFTTEQTAQWDGAEVALPAFAAVLGAHPEPATTYLLHSPDGVTAVHWDAPPVPARVFFLPLTPDASEEERARVRAEAVRLAGGSTTVIDLASPIEADAGQSDGELVFRAGEFVSRIPAASAAALDVRDKAELAALRGARRRDVILWRVALGAVAALLVLGLGEFALVGGRQWLKVRTREIATQKPLVDKITGLHELANRVDEIATKRLLPIEMVLASAAAKPAEIVFTQAVAERSRGLHTLLVQGRTANPAQISTYENALRALPSVESASATISQMQNERSTFQLTVVFRADALKPMPATKTASR